jgi:hypothetical protein
MFNDVGVIYNRKKQIRWEKKANYEVCRNELGQRITQKIPQIDLPDGYQWRIK